MKLTRKFLTLIFAAFLFIGFAAFDASAQRRGNNGRIVQRPVVVKRYYVRSYPYWYRNSWNNPYYYDPYFSDPYVSVARQRYNLQSELNGNREELRKHLEKYNADGVITDKERRELDDDYRDVERSEQKLKNFNRSYGRYN